MNNRFLVYRIINLRNGKQYVGITSRSVERRWIEHISDAKNGSPQALHRAIRKYGSEAFQVVLIATMPEWEEACEKEREAIIEYKSFVRAGMGYNATLGGEGTFGIDRNYQRGANNHCHRPGGMDHLRGDNNHMRREEHRERMRGDQNPARKPGTMDKIRGDANPARRPEVRIKMRQNHALNSAERREGVICKISQAIRGKPRPYMVGDRNPKRRPELRQKMRGSGNPNAKAVEIYGVLYGTLQDAAIALGVAQGQTIRSRIARGTPGYCYANAV